MAKEQNTSAGISDERPEYGSHETVEEHIYDIIPDDLQEHGAGDYLNWREIAAVRDQANDKNAAQQTRQPVYENLTDQQPIYSPGIKKTIPAERSAENATHLPDNKYDAIHQTEPDRNKSRQKIDVHPEQKNQIPTERSAAPGYTTTPGTNTISRQTSQPAAAPKKKSLLDKILSIFGLQKKNNDPTYQNNKQANPDNEPPTPNRNERDREKKKGLADQLLSVKGIAIMAVAILLLGLLFPPAGFALAALAGVALAGAAATKLYSAYKEYQEYKEYKSQKQNQSEKEYLSLEQKEALQNSLNYSVSPQTEENQQMALNVPPGNDQQVFSGQNNNNSNGVQRNNRSGKNPDEATEEIHVISNHMNLTADTKHQVGGGPVVYENLNTAKIMDRYNDNMNAVDHKQETEAQMRGEDKPLINKTTETHISNRSQETDRLPSQDEFHALTKVSAVSIVPKDYQRSQSQKGNQQTNNNQQKIPNRNTMKR